MKLVLFSTIAAAISLVAAIPLENASPVQQDASAAVPTGTTASSTSPSPISVTFSGILPSHSPTYLPSFPYNGHEKKSPTPTGALTYKPTFNVSSYPIPWDKPDLNNTEIQAAINSINWTYVPNIPPKNMTTDVTTYNSGADPDCWWTVSTCGEPKLTYLPKDVKYCPKVGDFGLTYDDGPLPPNTQENGENDPWAEPRLYDYLAEKNQTATLFYIGSNVVVYPEAAVRALEAGHTLCAHTWSHPQMTTITNEEIVAQLYLSVRSIKEATGVTTRCWRPPYGDVDDRVRAIAHQMGLSTIIWDSDSFDWGMPSVANAFQGQYNQSTIDGFFDKWVTDRKSGVDNLHGHVVLEHETSNVTILAAERWLPKLQEAFDVKTVHECAPELPNPYWEE